MYIVRYVYYRFSVLAVNIGTRPWWIFDNTCF